MLRDGCVDLAEYLSGRGSDVNHERLMHELDLERGLDEIERMRGSAKGEYDKVRVEARTDREHASHSELLDLLEAVERDFGDLLEQRAERAFQ